MHANLPYGDPGALVYILITGVSLVLGVVVCAMRLGHQEVAHFAAPSSSTLRSLATVDAGFGTFPPIMLSGVLLFTFALCGSSFRFLPFGLRSALHQPLLGASKFDGKELNQVMNELSPVGGQVKQDLGAYNVLQRELEARSVEEVHRSYPFVDNGLPVLPDCNNYYSGTYEKYFWLQNADQVFMYIPVPSDIERRDVQVSFEAKKVTVRLQGHELITFPCVERIIPDGSFWLFEVDKDGNKYIQLDMEKRYRMINWKGIFSPDIPDSTPEVSKKRTDMMEKLFAANQGMSKLSGVPPETMRELMQNGELTRMIADEVYDTPQATVVEEIDTDGNIVSEATRTIRENLVWEQVEDTDESYMDDEGAEGELETDEYDRLSLKDMNIIDAEVVESDS
jgi:hypothetical protein